VARLRIDLAYDGGSFRGFAAQRDQRTVQGVIEEALDRLTDRQAVGLTVAGRTDAGVHASTQVLHVDVADDARILGDLARARRSLDGMCGPEITVWKVRQVPASFDARFSATERRYVYRLCDTEAMDPKWRHDTWHVWKAAHPRLDASAMHEGGRHLVGEHDFSSFCRRADPSQHLMRRIDRLDVRRRPRGLVEVALAGPAFCHQMVRSVVGALLRVGRGQRSTTWVAEALAARDRHAVGHIAPPHGLTLVGVSYENAARS
jgi:tRNA pseudouridine38-40 synthase